MGRIPHTRADLPCKIMGYYTSTVLPRLIHATCGSARIRRLRARIIPPARGRVLEVGIGSGLNLPYYDPAVVTELYGLDPSPELLGIAAQAVGSSLIAPRWIRRNVEDLPLESASMDTIVMTFTLCSVALPQEGMRQMVRVLKPGGTLIFCEHGAAPNPALRRWQDRLTPIWKLLAGGCHLNRDVTGLLTCCGLRITALETTMIRKWWLAGFLFHGTATKPWDPKDSDAGLA